MAAHRLLPLVTVQVRMALEQCRAEGMDFDSAWASTVGKAQTQTRAKIARGDRVLLPHNSFERRAWREALASTRDEWQAAYNAEPSPLNRRLLERRVAAAAVDDASRMGQPMRVEHVLAEDLVAA